MRRYLSTTAVLACAVALAAGCGGDDSSGGPLESALAYVPADTPFAVAISTDLEGDQYRSLDSLLGRFPGGDSVGQQLEQQFEQGEQGVSFRDDVRPLLGNPFVVSATDVTSFLGDSEDGSFVAAVQVEDTDALDRLIDKTKADEQGEVAGATLYEDDGTIFAVEDDMVVFGGSRRQLESALERADGDDHMDAATFEDGLDGLPEDALARIYFDLQALIEQDPETQAARKVKWVSALRTFGMTASAADDSVEVEFNLKTEAGDLSDEDLPLAAGDESPEVAAEEGEIGFGFRDPSQIVSFFEAAFQAVEPESFGDYEAGKRALSQQLDLDFDRDMIGQLTGDLSVSLAVDGSYGARAEVRDADAFANTVDKLAEALPQLGAGLGVAGVERRGDLYEATLDSGARFFFGMSEGVFVAASDPARARGLGAQRPSAVSDAEGSFVLTADAQQVASQVLEQLGPQLGLGGALGANLFIRPLGELTGSVSTSTGGMKGRFSLTID